MGELSDRRAAKKARTREHIRETAQRLFAERGFESVTTVEVAAAADVAVQTVFNHFPTKEELFFADRTPWVEGPAAAVRNRPHGVPPEVALRDYLIDLVGTYLRGVGTPQHASLMQTMHASPALTAYERRLTAECEARVTTALAEAWEQPRPEEAEHGVPERPRLLAALVASVWLAAVRTLLVEYRTAPPARDDESAVEAVVASTRRILDDLHDSLPMLRTLGTGERTGWPQISSAG